MRSRATRGPEGPVPADSRGDRRLEALVHGAAHAIFAGEHSFHSRLEWVSAQDMELAVAVIVNLAAFWCQKSA